MNVSEIEQAFRDNGLLREVSAEHLSELAAIAEVVEFPAGTLILRDGDQAVKIFLIVSGSVSIEICAPGIGCRRIMTLSDGDLLNWSAVLEHQRSTASARAITATKMIAIDGHQLLALCEHKPALGFAFMRQVALAMAHRLTATRLQLIDVFGEAMPAAPATNPGTSYSEVVGKSAPTMSPPQDESRGSGATEDE